MQRKAIPAGLLSNGGVRRYLVEAQSTTGYVAWKTADGTILVSAAPQVTIAATPTLEFWSCARYEDITPFGEILLLDAHDNDLIEVDVSNLRSLRSLDCSDNKLRTLSLEGLIDLQVLDVDHNQLAQLDVRDLRSLRILNCTDNQLQALDVSGLAALEILDCSGNPILTLRHNGCGSLREISKP